jgi:hypothetical protein
MFTLLNPPPAGILPVHDRPQLSREVALLEDVVGNMGKPLKFRLGAVKLDALRDNVPSLVVEVNITEPQCGRNVLCQETVLVSLNIHSIEKSLDSPMTSFNADS